MSAIRSGFSLAALAVTLALTHSDAAAADKKLQLRKLQTAAPGLLANPKVLHGAGGGAADLIIVMMQPEPDPVEGLPNQGYCWKSPPGGPASHVIFALANNGGTTAPPSVVQVQFDDAGVREIDAPELPPGQFHSWLVTIPEGCYPGSYHGSCTYTIVADATNGVAETDESNNAVDSKCLLPAT
jgi:hypothetical protein